MGSPTLARPLRWRLRNAGVEKGAKLGSPTLAYSLAPGIPDADILTYFGQNVIAKNIRPEK